jgi:hypothetical protein
MITKLLNPRPESERDPRVVVLASLSWLLLLPVGWFLIYNPLARQTLFRGLLGSAYLAVAFYKLLRWSALFRKRDWITFAFVVLSVYVCAFAAILVWFWANPPRHAGDWAIDIAFFVLGGLFIAAGTLLVLAPGATDQWSQLQRGQRDLGQATSVLKRLRLGKRLSGVFLLTVGVLVFTVVIEIIRETWPL